MTTPRPELPPVLLGPESGRKVAEHIELSGNTGELPDPRDEAVGLLREIVMAFEDDNFLDEVEIARGSSWIKKAIRVLARIDK